MAADFAVKVVTPEGEAWSGRATSVVVPGLDGYFGVWKDHMPLIAAMDVGTLWIKTPEDSVLRKLLWFRAGGGVSERQWRDVVAVLRVGGESIDMSYVNTWAARLGIADLVARALSEAASG